jgi:hypothetical protein
VTTLVSPGKVKRPAVFHPQTTFRFSPVSVTKLPLLSIVTLALMPFTATSLEKENWNVSRGWAWKGFALKHWQLLVLFS